MCRDTTPVGHADAPAARPRGDEEDEALSTGRTGRTGGETRCAV
ncbi:hypothetical protein [Streptomyces fradiae]